MNGSHKKPQYFKIPFDDELHLKGNKREHFILNESWPTGTDFGF